MSPFLRYAGRPPTGRRTRGALLAVSGVALMSASCGDVGPAESPPVAFVFEDAASHVGLDFRHASGLPDRKQNMVFSVGGGVVVADFDGDEHLDLYFTTGIDERPGDRKPVRNRLYFGDGRGAFRPGKAGDPAEVAAFGLGAVAADYDRDGDVDLYVCNRGPNVLLRNRGDGTFEDVTATAGVGDPSMSAAAAFGDLDGDGWLDLYVANYFTYQGPTGPGPRDCTWAGFPVGCGPRGFPAEPDRVYRNKGDGTFEDASERFGLRAESPRYGLSVAIFDADRDGDRDVYVANDTQDNYFWENDGKGGLTDVAMMNGSARSGEGVAQAGMAVTVEDLNGDGRLDLVTTAFARDYNTVYFRRSDGSYDDVTSAIGVARPTWNLLAFGCNAEDFDADGWPELFFANGHVFPEVDKQPVDSTYLQSNQLLRNVGDGKFVDVSASSGPAFKAKALGRGSAAGDFDEDGRVDIVVNNLDGPPALLMNRTPLCGATLRVRLRGAPGRHDRTCVGAIVTVEAGGRTWSKESMAGGSYASCSLADLSFGLGAATKADVVTVRYPDGTSDVRRDVPLGGVVRFERKP